MCPSQQNPDFVAALVYFIREWFKAQCEGPVELKAKDVNVMNEIATRFNAAASTFRRTTFWITDLLDSYYTSFISFLFFFLA